MAQVNTRNGGYVNVLPGVADTRTLITGNSGENALAAIEMSRDNVVELRRLLWDAIRKDGRGFDINIEEVVEIEEVQHKPRYSVSGYAEEIEWMINLLQTHLTRVEEWKDATEADREMFGKLDGFLSQFEEM